MIRGAIVGVVATLVAIFAIGFGTIKAGIIPANADGKVPGIEKWAARASLHAALAREAPKGENPLPLNDANAIAGIKLYATNCAVCHGAADGVATNIAKGLYQKPPQLATDGVEDDPDGVTYWKIAHGIRFTGMPAFDGTLSEQQIWQISLFLKHMDALSPAAQRVWKSVRI
jgi:mono/diheme cytochrome c family protein